MIKCKIEVNIKYFTGGFMSGDIGIHEETIVFYDKTMTETKMVLLNLKGIKLNYKESKPNKRK